MDKIKSVNVNLPMGEVFYSVGELVHVGNSKNKIISRIDGYVMEHENSVSFIYNIMVDDNTLYAKIVNSPVTIVYEIGDN